MTRLRAALVGLGIMGINHARVLSSLEGVELVGVSDPQGDPRNAFPAFEVKRSIEEIIQLKPDYCVIAAPTAFHEQIALKLIDEGIHIIIEKPVSHTGDSAQRIREAADANSIIGAVGHIERFNAALREARKRIHNGDLGEIYQVTTRRIGPFPSRISDVGVVMDLATHDIDLTSWLTDQDYVNVSAQVMAKSGREHEDMLTVVGKLKNGVIVNHNVNWLSPLKERKTVITGEKGTFVVDTLTTDLSFYANGTVDVSQKELAHFKGVSQGDIQIYAFDKPEPLKVEHENFRDAISGKSAEIVTLSSGEKTVRIAEAILRSASKSEVVTL